VLWILIIFSYCKIRILICSGHLYVWCDNDYLCTACHALNFLVYYVSENYGHIDQLLNRGYVWICLRTYVWVCVCVCMHVCMCVCLCLCVHKLQIWIQLSVIERYMKSQYQLYLNLYKYEMSCSSHSPVHVSKGSLDCCKWNLCTYFCLAVRLM
jgi:hypothetical protein